MSTTHVILGGNGVIGRETAQALLATGVSVGSVGRRASTVPGVTSVIADLLDRDAVRTALDGADVAYLTAGLPYSAALWEQRWPRIVENVIEAAVATGTHLVSLDNVYAYGAVDGPMTEGTPLAPVSRKGRVRARAAAALAAAVAERGLVSTVGRSADFFGPGASTSVFNSFGIDPIAAGRPGTWLYDADLPHSLTYTPDVGRGLAILGTDTAARGRLWHLPTGPALTGRDYLRLAGGHDGPIKIMGAAMMRIGSLFNAGARETREMSYQYTAPYRFDSSAFELAFGVRPTPIADAVAETVRAAGAGVRA
ncbi:NAD-dependent epimerase/dehydratase family protein [Plantibacter sp. VKM Ac-2880]|uniref:NAD-dependent epimerase/dehydratase family protein n=1 Tax=Plantibacter sp. VKM Ac-2880 TaxID=2783827 RepID=UPI00188FD66A|nr:NAD-dependent epimerase/dehydratase family protein [Plantibacter sp. VKM Ac-2880]MBF4567265.1 NAD-dependent epimerase/dehydratase family protein [Plantibacter sp. VKM Ac-2880]